MHGSRCARVRWFVVELTRVSTVQCSHRNELGRSRSSPLLIRIATRLALIVRSLELLAAGLARRERERGLVEQMTGADAQLTVLALVLMCASAILQVTQLIGALHACTHVACAAARQCGGERAARHQHTTRHTAAQQPLASS